MESWRCPHCGSPQREAAQCWVCRRSTTSCASCRHFRNAVANRLGYCALDRRRLPITGDEERACWERAPAETATDPPADGMPQPVPSNAGGLWGGAQTLEALDRPADGHGLWSEPDSARDRESARNSHGGSIRSRPWGPVPGLREDAGKRRGVGLR